MKNLYARLVIFFPLKKFIRISGEEKKNNLILVVNLNTFVFS